MLKVFISWSGERSGLVASALADWLPKVIQSVQPWMSVISIPKGEKWSSRIGEALTQQDIGIFCVTPENYFAPWLVFEAGALAGAVNQAKVCPLIIGFSPDDLEGPLCEFQATIFEKKDFFCLIQTLNNLLGEHKLRDQLLQDVFERFWPVLEERVKEVMAVELKGKRTEIKQIIKVFSKYGFCEPIVGDYAAFETGYESHQLYSIAASVACKRLYIYGRKNRKFFDKEHFDFFKSLPEKIAKGFDLKILFLDPAAPSEVIRKAHHDSDFPKQLEASIPNAIRTLTHFDIDYSSVCRKYTIERPSGLTVIDEAVLYAPFEYDQYGMIKSTTRSSFSIVNACSQIGEHLIADFLNTWKYSKPL